MILRDFRRPDSNKVRRVLRRFVVPEKPWRHGMVSHGWRMSVYPDDGLTETLNWWTVHLRETRIHYVSPRARTDTSYRGRAHLGGWYGDQPSTPRIYRYRLNVRTRERVYDGASPTLGDFLVLEEMEAIFLKKLGVRR